MRPWSQKSALIQLPNPGQGDCFAYALADASYGAYPAASLRQRAQSFLVNNPALLAQHGLTAQEFALIGRNGEELTDQQARIFSRALATDILILDTPSNLARYISHGAGEVNYLPTDACRNMLHSRRNDLFNPLRIIKYTPGHYEGVCWPQ